MYLLAFLAALFVPLLGLPLGILGLYGDKKHQKVYIVCISLAFAAIAYGYQARSLTDMTRYWGMVEEYINRNVSLSEAFRSGFYGSDSTETLWLVNIFLWLASRIGDPRIIPALSTFFVYYMSLSMTCRICKEHEISRKQMIFYILFSLAALNLYAIANNVRNVLAFLMVSYATFYDVYLHKRNVGVWALYILPIFIHTSAIIFLILRLFIRPIRKLRIAGMIVVVLLYPVLEVLNTLAGRMTGSLAILGGAIMKAYRYFNDTSSEWGLEVQASGSEKVFKIVYIALALILCVMWILTERKKVKENLLSVTGKEAELKLINNYTFYVGLMAVACAPMLRPEYWRFSATAIALGGGIFTRTKQRGIRNHFFDLAWMGTAGIGIIGMILWVRNLTIYAEPLSTLVAAAGASPLLILLKAMMNLAGIG